MRPVGSRKSVRKLRPQPARISRVGVDLVRVADVGLSIEQFGDRYLHRIFTARELGDSLGPGGTLRLPQLAARFAAKEAAVKVLRPVRHWFNWRQIEILRDAGGWVTLHLHDAAGRHAAREGLMQFSVSLSHEHEYAVAMVMGSA